MTAPQYERSIYARGALGQPGHVRPGAPRQPLKPPPPVFFTVQEIADRMRVSKMTVYRLIHNGELRASRFGRSFRVSEAALADYLRTADTIDGDGE